MTEKRVLLFEIWVKWCLGALFHLTNVAVEVWGALLFVHHTRIIALYHYTLWGNLATVLGTPWSRQYTYWMSLSVAKHVWLFKRCRFFSFWIKFSGIAKHILAGFLELVLLNSELFTFVCGRLFMTGFSLKSVGKLWQKVWTTLSQEKLWKNQKGHKCYIYITQPINLIATVATGP